MRRGSWMVMGAIAWALVSAGVAAAYEREVEGAAGELARRLEEAKVGSVAVVDFTDLRGNGTELGRFLADELSAALADSGSRLRVVDRLRLAQILKELELSATGLLDPETARTVGKIAGVEALVTGRLTPFRDTVRQSLLALRTETAEIVVATDANVPRTEVISELEGRTLTVECGREPGDLKLVLEGPPLQQVEVREYEMALHGCVRVGGAVRCGVAVKNRGKERNLLLSGKTRAVFAEGGQVQATRVGVGGLWADGTLSRAGSPLLPNVATTVGVVFERVPEGVEVLRLLELDFYGFEVRFRDVPVTR